jgi:hypothetical protein
MANLGNKKAMRSKGASLNLEPAENERWSLECVIDLVDGIVNLIARFLERPLLTARQRRSAGSEKRTDQCDPRQILYTQLFHVVSPVYENRGKVCF